MFGDPAAQLITMLGASGSIPGAMAADDIPAALVRLRHGLQAHATLADAPADTNATDDDEPRIALATRAAPLLDLLERAGAAKVPVMREVA